ncbi:unnamed protein product [Calypogeia fissa]
MGEGASHLPRSSSTHDEMANSCKGPCTFQRLGSDLEQLVGNGNYSDFVVAVQGREYALHRCILSVRSSFFRDYFRNASNEEANTRMDLGRVMNLEGVGCEAFVSVIKFLYGARERLLGSLVSCLDETCAHDACWPAVNYALDYLRMASVFELRDLMNEAEEHLLILVDKVPVEYILTILVIARTHGFEKLRSTCLVTLAKAKWNYLSLEKLLPTELVEEIKKLKKEHGHNMPSEEDEKIDKQARRVQRALESDDVELVQLLLKEGNVDFNQVHGLHYAAAYCDEKTVRELLDLQLSDPNQKNYRDLTVLHIACMRREPEILAGLLAKGARSREPTPDGRTPSQIVKRLTKSGDSAEDETQRARLCLEILDQAEAQITYPQSFRDVVYLPITDEKVLVQKLLYLENRVALARMLFPREAQIVLSLAHVEATAEYTGVDNGGPDSPSGSPALYNAGSPTVHQSGSAAPYHVRKEGLQRQSLSDNMQFELSVTGLDANLLDRVNALRRAVELGHRFFPRCSAMLNKYMDDDLCELSVSMDKVLSEEPSAKRQRLNELKDILAEAFTQDVADMDHQKGFKKLPPSLSSSPSSSPPLGASPLVTPSSAVNGRQKER